MSMFRKEGSSGGNEHPAPKLSLLSSHRQASTGGGIAIRFNASSSFDDDDDTGEGITVVTETPATAEGSVAMNNSSHSNTAQVAASARDSSNVRLQQNYTTNSEQLQNGRQEPTAGGEKPVSENHRTFSQQETKVATIGLNNTARSPPISKLSFPRPSDMDRLPSVATGNEDRAPPHVKTKEHRVFSRTQDSEEKVSILSGIRGRLQDKFHDNLTAVIGKIEEISGDSKLGEAIERRLKKGDSFDSSRSTSHQHKKTNGLGTSSAKRTDKKPCEEARSRHASGGSSHTIGSEIIDAWDGSGVVRSSSSTEVLGTGPLSSASLGSLSGRKDEEHLLPTQEGEVFTESGGDERVKQVTRKQRPSSTSGVESTTDMSRVSMKGLKMKEDSTRQFPSTIESSQSVPVSMSALLSHTDADLEEEEVGIECDQEFFDLQEEQAKKQGSKSELHNTDSPEAQMDETPMVTENQNLERHRNLPFNIACTRNNVLSIVVALVAVVILPLPSFVSGILIGGFLGVCSLSVFQWVTEPLKSKEPIHIPDVRKQPPLRVPYMRESKNEDGKFKGWMNELPFYDPATYHISNTKSVYLQLEGTDLRLQTPKQGIPKRALWTEPKVFPTSFIKQRFLNLTECSVSLLPEGLVSKRIWSKKYPICIVSRVYKKDSKNLSGSPDLEEAKHLGFDSLSGDLSSGNTKCLYLFARTCREKEEWFHRLVAASRCKPLSTSLSEMISKANSHCIVHKSGSAATLSSMESGRRPQQQPFPQRRGSCDSSNSETFSNIELEMLDNSEKVTMEYLRYMTKVMPDMGGGDGTKGKRDSRKKQKPVQKEEETGFTSLTNQIECEPSVLWTNALLGRLFFDFLREQYWADKVRAKIQGKLSKIHVPYFIDKLTVTGIELGSQVPVIQRISRPFLDERGIWFDLDIVYSGGFSMTLETKVNLMKLKKTSDFLERKQEAVVMETHKASAVTDSGEEDSAESSTDEEAEEEYSEERLVQTEPARKKLLKIVDKIAASKYFQQATENKYIKKAMEGVSNTRLVLSVEMRSCVGTMVLNIPPPPTDRLWYGFRKNPSLVLSAKPRVGQREVSVAHIVEWIENKLALEFQRVLVLPNMDDLEIPLMCAHLSDQASEEEREQEEEQRDNMDTSLLNDNELDQ